MKSASVQGSHESARISESVFGNHDDAKIENTAIVFAPMAMPDCERHHPNDRATPRRDSRAGVQDRAMSLVEGTAFLLQVWQVQ
jgi:hypothetical protein